MAAAPALLGGIMDKASSEDGAASIFDMLGDGSELSGLANLNADSVESEGLLSKGQDLVTIALGDKATGVIDMVSSLSGIEKEKSSSLLSVAGSMIGGVLGKQKAESSDLGSFVGLLSNQGSFLDKFAPAGLTSLLGLASFSGISGKLGDLAGGALGLVGDTGKAALDGAGKVVGGAAGLAGDAGKAALGGAGKVAGAAAGLAGNAGKAALGGADKVASAATGAAKAGGSSIKKILPWAIGLLALLFLFFLLRGCDSDKSLLDNVTDAASETTGTVTDAGNSAVDAAGNAVDAAGNAVGTVVDATGNAVDAAGNAVNAAGNAITSVAGGIKDASGNMVNAFGDIIGKFFSADLPNGTKLNIPEGGFEDNLLNFMKDGKMEAGKYYAFDRLYFNTGSSSLSDDSINQIENVAAIMKAYPNVKFLFRGHTDNTGSVEGNNKLSASRALSVKNKLVEKGIDVSRVATKGMGSIAPIAENETPEGRAKNRRIDVSIVK